MSQQLQSSAEVLSAMSTKEKNWMRDTLERGFIDSVKCTLKGSHNVTDKGIMDDILFVLKRTDSSETSDKNTTKKDSSFAATKRRMGMKFNTLWQAKLALIRPDCQDASYVNIKEEFNEMNWDNDAQEKVKEYIDKIFDLQKNISKSKEEATQKLHEIKSLTIKQFVKDINDREKQRVLQWQAKKERGQVQGKKASSEKNKKITAKYSVLMEAKKHWTGEQERVTDIIGTIDKLSKILNVIKSSDKMDVMTGDIEIVIPQIKVLNRLKNMKKDSKQIIKTIKSIVSKFQSLTNEQVWIKQSGARNKNFAQRYESHMKHNKKRRGQYSEISKEKEKKATTKSTQNNTNSKAPTQNRKRKRNSNTDNNSNSKAPPPKKRRISKIDSYGKDILTNRYTVVETVVVAK
eukprot:321491_1